MIVSFRWLVLVASISHVWAVELQNEQNGEPKPTPTRGRRGRRNLYQDGLIAPYKSPGYHSRESIRNRKIVQLLAKKDNGVNNYDHAKRLAEDYLTKVRQEDAKRSREYVQRQKEQGLKRKFKPRPGYQTYKNRFERKLKIIKSKNPEIEQDKAAKIVERELKMESKRRSEVDKKRIQRLRLERQNNQACTENEVAMKENTRKSTLKDRTVASDSLNGQ